jgi:hypothetical protein
MILFVFRNKVKYLFGRYEVRNGSIAVARSHVPANGGSAIDPGVERNHSVQQLHFDETYLIPVYSAGPPFPILTTDSVSQRLTKLEVSAPTSDTIDTKVIRLPPQVRWLHHGHVHEESVAIPRPVYFCHVIAIRYLQADAGQDEVIEQNSHSVV